MFILICALNLWFRSPILEIHLNGVWDEEEENKHKIYDSNRIGNKMLAILAKTIRFSANRVSFRLEQFELKYQSMH